MKTTNKEVNKGHQVKIEAQITEGINDINDLIQKQCIIKDAADLEVISTCAKVIAHFNFLSYCFYSVYFSKIYALVLRKRDSRGYRSFSSPYHCAKNTTGFRFR